MMMVVKAAARVVAHDSMLMNRYSVDFSDCVF